MDYHGAALTSMPSTRKEAPWLFFVDANVMVTIWAELESER